MPDRYDAIPDAIAAFHLACYRSAGHFTDGKDPMDANFHFRGASNPPERAFVFAALGGGHRADQTPREFRKGACRPATGIAARRKPQNGKAATP